MRKKIYLLFLMIAISIYAAASEKDDLRYLDELYKQKKFQIAVTESENFLNNYPKSKYTAAIAERAGKTSFLLNNHKDAVNYFIQALNTEKSDNVQELNYYIARSYAILGDKQKSDAFLNSIPNSNQYYERGAYDIGMYYLSKDDYTNAKIKLNETASLNRARAKDAYLGLALMSYNSKKYSDAKQYLDKIPAQKEGTANYSMINYLYGSIYSKENNIAQAEARFEAVTKTDTSSQYGMRSLTSLIDIYLKNNEYSKIDSAFAKMKTEKDRWNAARMIGDSYADKGNYTKALEYYSRSNDQKDLQKIYGQSYSLYKLDRFQEAQNGFNKLVNTSYYPKALYYIFSIDYKLKNYKKIIDNRNLVNKVKLSNTDKNNINAIIANSAYESGNYDLAIGFYKETYQKSPTKENLYRIIAIAAKNNNVAQLESSLNNYKQKFPDDQEYKKRIYNAVATVFYNKGKQNEAIELYKDYLNTTKDKDILNNLISMLLNEQRYNELLTYIDMADDSLNNTYLRAIANIGVGQYEKANTILDQIINDEKADDDIKNKAKFNKVRNYFLWEKYQDTIKSGDEYLAIESAPDKNEIIDKIGISYFRIDNFDKSREYFQKLIENKDTSQYAKFQIAETYYGQKDYNKAKESYKALYDEDPSGEYAEKSYYWYLNVLANLKEMDTFNSEKDTFLEKYPNSPMRDNILMLSGAIYENLKDSTKAVAYYKDLYSSTKDKKVQNNAGEKIIDILINNKKDQEAKDFIADIKDADTKAYYNSMLLLKEGNKEEALKENEKLLNNDKYKDYASINIADIYFEQGNNQKARESYEKISQLDESQYKDKAMFQLAAISEKENKQEEALSAYTRSYVMYNGDYFQVSKLKAAQLSEKLGKEKEAESLYKELYQLGTKLKYKIQVTDRMTYYALKNGNKAGAKKYYTELDKLDKEVAKKYMDKIK